MGSGRCNNAVEFRARYRKITRHPGVISWPPSVRREQQILLFEAALDDIEKNTDVVNQALDVALAENGGIVIRRYRLP